MPNRDVVRSLSCPKAGLAKIDSSDPTPATRARLAGARSVPTSEFTLSANVTSNGAMSIRQLLMKANV